MSAASGPPAAAAASDTVMRRISVRFAPDGQSAAGLAARQDGQLFAELWSWHGHEPVVTALPGSTSESHRTQVIPVPGGEIVALRLRSGAHQVLLLRPGGRPTREIQAGVLASRAARLLPSPDPAVAGLVITDGPAGGEIWQVISGPEPSLRRVLQVAQPLGGGIWLDEHGRLLSVQYDFGGRVRPAIVNIGDGSLVPDPWLADQDGGGPALVWCAHPGTGLRLVARPGAARPLSLVRPGQPARTLTALNSFTGTAEPLAFDPEGRRLALHAKSGVRSRIISCDLETGTADEIQIPAGTVLGGAAWSAHGLRFAFTGPGLPAGLATAGENGSWRVDGTSRRPDTARPEQLTGPAGPIEAVVYGGQDWATAPRLVIALHGGPADRWTLAYHPLLAGLASAGSAVLAPNQRGSTGYGREFREAICGAWAVPDLADLIALAEDLARRRPAGLARPVLYGASYGAFLAMVAVAARPDLWHSCVAVAPFLSAPQLRRTAAQPVRTMLDRQRACEPAADALGPRDLTALFAPRPPGRPRIPVYLLHGRRDEVIPAEHSRQLAAALRQAGWTDGTDLFHHEIPDASHEVFEGCASAAASIASVAGFIRHGAPASSRGGPAAGRPHLGRR